jgi:hypothetical protein
LNFCYSPVLEILLNFIIIELFFMYDVLRLRSVSWTDMYFDMFYIQWHHLAKEDLWNKLY